MQGLASGTGQPLHRPPVVGAAISPHAAPSGNIPAPTCSTVGEAPWITRASPPNLGKQCAVPRLYLHSAVFYGHLFSFSGIL